MVFICLFSAAFAPHYPSVGVPSLSHRHLRGDVLLGYSLTNLSLRARHLDRIVVDDASSIENISRYIEEGECRFQAALTGSAADSVFTIVR